MFLHKNISGRRITFLFKYLTVFLHNDIASALWERLEGPEIWHEGISVCIQAEGLVRVCLATEQNWRSKNGKT